jgi:hypothetical protein
MSSYYFADDTDQGPPETPPGCGDAWVCEHRWKSIGMCRHWKDHFKNYLRSDQDHRLKVTFKKNDHK